METITKIEKNRLENPKIIIGLTSNNFSDEKSEFGNTKMLTESPYSQRMHRIIPAIRSAFRQKLLYKVFKNGQAGARSAQFVGLPNFS